MYMSTPISQCIPPFFPPWYPYICSLYLCLYFCFANKTIYTTFLDSTYILVQSLSCVWLCEPMNCSMPGFPVHHQLPEIAQTHAIQPSHPLPSPLLPPSIMPSIRCFSTELALRIRWPKYRASASTSVLPMNVQGRFPLRLTGLISLQSKKLSRVFSSTTIRKHQLWSLLNPKFSALKTDCIVSINIVTLHFFLFEVEVILTLVSNKLSFLLTMNCFGDF